MASFKAIIRRFPTRTDSFYQTEYPMHRFMFYVNSHILKSVKQRRDQCCLCSRSTLHTSSRNHSVNTRNSAVTPPVDDSSSVTPPTNDVSKTVFHNQPPSWLFVSNKFGGHYQSGVSLDLGLKERLQGPELADLKNNIEARGMNFDLDELVTEHNDMKNAQMVLKKHKQKLKQASDNTNKESSETISSTKKEIKIATSQINNIEEGVFLKALKLPNSLHPSTPLNNDPVILREKSGTREPQNVNHVEAGLEHRLIKFSNVGPKAYYLRGELAVAEWTVSDLACDFMEKRGFRQIKGPDFFKSPIVEACGQDFFNTDEVLTLQNWIKDLKIEAMTHLGGVSPAAFAGYVARLCITDIAMPYHMFSCGKRYQKSDLPGLFGATQSTQVGLFSCLRESEVDAQFEATTDIVWALLQSLGFSIRLVQMPASQLRPEERRRVEFQVFAPSLKEFIPIGHVSDLGDFVSRRLMSCHTDDPTKIRNAKKLHMISGTVMNVTSLLAVWVEHTDLATSGL